MTVWWNVKQDSCRKFANEDETPPATPVEKKVTGNNEKCKKMIGVRKMFHDHNSKGEFHLLVKFPRQISQYLAWPTERVSICKYAIS